MIDARTPQQRRRDGVALQAIEGNPLTADDFAMFEMFDRQGWSPERRRAYIIQQALKRVPAIAAE